MVEVVVKVPLLLLVPLPLKEEDLVDVNVFLPVAAADSERVAVCVLLDVDDTDGVLEPLLDADTVEDTDTVEERRGEIEPTLEADVVLEAVEDLELVDDTVELCVPRSDREVVALDVCVSDSLVLRVLVGLLVVDLELLVVADVVLL